MEYVIAGFAAVLVGAGTFFIGSGVYIIKTLAKKINKYSDN